MNMKVNILEFSPSKISALKEKKIGNFTLDLNFCTAVAGIKCSTEWIEIS